MTRNQDGPRTPQPSVILVVLYIVAFGGFMGIRTQFSSSLARVTLAACGGAFLGLAIAQGIRRK